MLYIALPAILDTNPFQDTDEDSDKKPQEVETVISIFQTTYDVVKAYSVHEDIIHQLFAYLFFFTNASLFNTLMERGAGGKFYRWAKGAQIRGNLDLLESWAAHVQLLDEANDYLNRLSTAADLLATPKVQLLQVCPILGFKVFQAAKKQLGEVLICKSFFAHFYQCLRRLTG